MRVYTTSTRQCCGCKFVFDVPLRIVPCLHTIIPTLPTGSGTIMTAGAFSQISIVTVDAYGSLLSSGGSLVLAHMCDNGVANEHGNAPLLQLSSLRHPHVKFFT
jgi:hypothetical protein